MCYSWELLEENISLFCIFSLLSISFSKCNCFVFFPGCYGSNVVITTNREGVTIPCDLELSHDHHVIWSRGLHSPITIVPGVLEVYANHSLVILPFEDNAYNRTIHDVTYRCIATNASGTIVSRSTHVKAGRKEISILFIYLLCL